MNEQAPTVRSRALAAGVLDDDLTSHFERDAVWLDGAPVADLDAPAPAGTRITIAGTRTS